MAKKEQFKAKDKITHKMTRDGLVTVNQSTGEETRASQRGQDFNLQEHRQSAIPGNARQASAGYAPASGKARQPQAPQTANPVTESGETYSQIGNKFEQSADGRQTDYPHGEHEPARGDYTEPDTGNRPDTASRPERTGESGREPYHAGSTNDSSHPRRGGHINRQQYAEHAVDSAQRRASAPESEYNPIQDAAGQADTATPSSARYETGNPQKATQNATAPTRDGRASQQAGRLRFGEAEQAQTKPSRQKGTRYHQKFAADAEKPEQPPISRDAAGIPATEVPDAGRTHGRATERPERLRFDETQHTQSVASGQKGRRPIAGTKYQRKFLADAEKPEQIPAPRDEKGIPIESPDASRRHDEQRHEPRHTPGESGTTGPEGTKRGKLQFSTDDMPPEPLSNKLTKARRKSERMDAKLEKARGKLPVKRKIRLNKEFDADKGKMTRKFHIEKEVKSQRAHLKVPLPLRPVKHGANAAIGYGHKKMYQVEHENVGIKAAHRAELAAEWLGRSALRFAKTRPYRRVAKLERQATKAHIKLSYRQTLEDNPKLKSNLLSRMMQKQKIKRQYAKAAREAQKAAKRAKKGGDLIGKAAQAVAGFIKRHPGISITILLLALLTLFIMTSVTSCSNLAGGGFSSVFMSSYLAEDADIDNAELAYTEWETDLQLQIDNAEADHPGYDEYRYSVDDIGHNPFELMAYLTARYQDFTYAAVQSDLRAIFAEQYKLEFVEEIEVRYRTETHTDPETGESYDVEVPYNWYILNIKLTARSFDEVIAPRMDAAQREMYGVYMETHGNRQYLLNPFAFDWLPYVSSYYGWRVHPITGAKDYHKGIDIAVPTGTDILAGHDGRVVSAGNAGDYGLVVVLDDGKAGSPGGGLVSKYAHCDSLLVSVGQEVKKGDVIAKSGNTGNSTGPHLHLEVIKDGQYLNPLFFAEGANGGAAPGSPGGPVIPDYSGAPLGDGSYAALIAAAEAHLGKPYVFGAKGPNAFDCSGFVCAALRESGVKNISTNAQGIYNACTPVSLANAQPGDLLFFHSTYSTSNTVTHVAIYCGGNVMLHAGKPVQYTTFDTTYWQNHFYAVGRINP